MKCEVGKSWFIPVLGRTVYPGEVVELADDVAYIYMHNEPGLFKPVRQTAQARVEAVRSDEPVKPKSRTARSKK